MKQRAIVCLMMSSLLACGDDGGHVHGIPDSNPADARVCGAVTPVTTAGNNLFPLDFLNYVEPDGNGADGVIRWVGDLNEMIDGSPAFYQIAFYSGIDDPLTGTFSLTAGNQLNYETCSICIRAFTYDPQAGTILKRFYQSGGSITLNKDPIATKTLDATITGLTLEEVTIDANTAHSDPVPGGTCVAYNGASWMHDTVPNAWTCEHAKYGSGGNCTCAAGPAGCGVQDPDCVDTATLEGCTSGNACWDGGCVTRPGNDVCAGATVYTLPNTTGITGTTAGAKHNYSEGLATCLGYVQNGTPVPDPQPGPDVAYVVTLTQNLPYTISLTGMAADADLSVSVVGPAPTTNSDSICTANPITTCVAGTDEGFDGDDETLQYTPTATGLYYILVDSYDYNVGGTFTLKVTQP